jgi:hypothetical protein
VSLHGAFLVWHTNRAASLPLLLGGIDFRSCFFSSIASNLNISTFPSLRCRILKAHPRYPNVVSLTYLYRGTAQRKNGILSCDCDFHLHSKKERLPTIRPPRHGDRVCVQKPLRSAKRAENEKEHGRLTEALQLLDRPHTIVTHGVGVAMHSLGPLLRATSKQHSRTRAWKPPRPQTLVLD